MFFNPWPWSYDLRLKERRAVAGCRERPRTGEMPSVAVKLYSVLFKFLLKQKLQSLLQNNANNESTFGITSRKEESMAAANPSFTEGVATKDIHIDPRTSLSVRIFLPEAALASAESDSRRSRAKSRGSEEFLDKSRVIRRSSSGAVLVSQGTHSSRKDSRRSSYGCGSSSDPDCLSDGMYRGYSPCSENCRRLPVMVQFHGGGFVCGSNESVANDFFCRRIAKLCEVVVIAVGYRLAPENRYPAAFEDGVKVLNWLAKQSILAECNRSRHFSRGGGVETRRYDARRHIIDAFGASMVEPWLAAHGDPTRCVMLGAGSGANIANHVSRTAGAEAGGRSLEPVKVVAQVLMYPFFAGTIPTHSEIRMANSYFYDKSMCSLAWRLFLPESGFSFDHVAANPLLLAPGRGPQRPKPAPPTLTVVAEHDWMRDRAIAYSEELRREKVDAPVLDYKDTVHGFATLDMLLQMPQAQACAEDIAIWVKKYISVRGHEFSY